MSERTVKGRSPQAPQPAQARSPDGESLRLVHSEDVTTITIKVTFDDFLEWCARDAKFASVEEWACSNWLDGADARMFRAAFDSIANDGAQILYAVSAHALERAKAKLAAESLAAPPRVRATYTTRSARSPVETDK